MATPAVGMLAAQVLGSRATGAAVAAHTAAHATTTAIKRCTAGVGDGAPPRPQRPKRTAENMSGLKNVSTRHTGGGVRTSAYPCVLTIT